jgi:hypothetical protein
VGSTAKMQRRIAADVAKLPELRSQARRLRERENGSEAVGRGGKGCPCERRREGGLLHIGRNAAESIEFGALIGLRRQRGARNVTVPATPQFVTQNSASKTRVGTCVRMRVCSSRFKGTSIRSSVWDSMFGRRSLDRHPIRGQAKFNGGNSIKDIQICACRHARADRMRHGGNCPTACYTRFRSWRWWYKFLMAVNILLDELIPASDIFLFHLKKPSFLVSFCRC